MGDNRTDLPEGTDTVIDTDASPSGDVVVTETKIVSEQESSKSGKLIDRLRSGGEDLTSQAGERARGLVSQGLERSAEALSNVSKLVGDTADGLDERLGPEFGEYARKAASAIENTANSIATKDADELIEDTRNFVRNSPGVAIAGAAIVGFALARLLKSGLSSRDDEDDDA
jgi:ElaB/YqjD/DUF883 family membrane-anchored ribosome-binding protein